MATDKLVAETERALEAACRKVDSDIPPAAERNREAASGAIDAALDLARTARRSQSNPRMRAVVVEDPDTHVGDLTAKFRALKPT